MRGTCKDLRFWAGSKAYTGHLRCFGKPLAQHVQRPGHCLPGLRQGRLCTTSGLRRAKLGTVGPFQGNEGGSAAAQPGTGRACRMSMMPKYSTTSSGCCGCPSAPSGPAGSAVATTLQPSCTRRCPMLWLISSVAPALKATGLHGGRAAAAASAPLARSGAAAAGLPG